MIISSFIYVAANSIISFFFMAEQYSMVRVHHISLSVHLSIDIQVVSCAAMNIRVHVSHKRILTGLHTTQNELKVYQKGLNINVENMKVPKESLRSAGSY